MEFRGLVRGVTSGGITWLRTSCCAAVMRELKLSRWNGSVGVLPSVSKLRVDSTDILRSLSALSFFSC